MKLSKTMMTRTLGALMTAALMAPLTAQADPDLDMENVAAEDGGFSRGDTIDVDTSVTNTGTSDATSYKLTYYLSDDMTITTADRPLGDSTDHGMLMTGNTDNDTQTFELCGVDDGDYYVGVIISYVKPADSNAGNHNGMDAIAVTITGDDGDEDTCAYTPGFSMNAAVNDAWFKLEKAGQGFFFNVFPDLEVFFLSWFTYDAERPDDSIEAILGEAGHRWVTAFGGWVGNLVTLDVELTTGGVFNSPEPEVDQEAGYGTIWIRFLDCNNAILSYDFPSLGLSGAIMLTRVTTDNVALCETLSDG